MPHPAEIEAFVKRWQCSGAAKHQRSTDQFDRNQRSNTLALYSEFTHPPEKQLRAKSMAEQAQTVRGVLQARASRSRLRR